MKKMIKIYGAVLPCMVILAIMLSGWCQTEALAAEKVKSIELIYANAYAPNHPQVGLLAEEWAAKVKEATEGRVIIRCVHGGALLSGQDMLSGIQKQVADAGSLVISFFPGQFPISSQLGSTIDLGVGDKLDIYGVSAITEQLYKEFPELNAEYTNIGLTPLFFVPTPEFYFLSNSAWNTIEDFKGKKIRCPGANLATLVKSIGATPLSVSGGEVYTSLQTGVIDSNFTDAPYMVSSKFYEVAKHLTILGHGGAGLPLFDRIGYAINTKSLKKLSSQDQEILLKVSKKMAAVATDKMKAESQKALNALKKNGVEFHYLSAEDIAKWDKESPDWTAVWAKDLNAKKLPGSQIASRYNELANGYGDGTWKPQQ
jgi:TRAP-type C4-dicarboxylate transport system substrate-binding protein